LAIAGLTAPLTAAFLIADRRAAAPCCPPAVWRFPVTLVPFSLAVVAGSAVATPALHRIGALWWPTGPSGPT